MTRIFVPSPALHDLSEIEAYAERLGAIRVAGFLPNPDGSYRASVEITPEAASDEIDEQSEDIEMRARRLEETAERLRT